MGCRRRTIGLVPAEAPQLHDPDGEVVRLRQVDRSELHAAVPVRQQQGCVPRQPVELGDDEDGAGDLRQVQRLGELRPVRVASALHLGEPGENGGAALSGVSLDRLALRFYAEAAGALPVD
jgi:hypothetical protein